MSHAISKSHFSGIINRNNSTIIDKVTYNTLFD